MKSEERYVGSLLVARALATVDLKNLTGHEEADSR